MSEILHIASLILQQQPEQRASLQAWIAGHPQVELALSEGNRHVLLCEAGDQASLLQVIDALRELPGVYSVNLVHHHAEAAHSLYEEI